MGDEIIVIPTEKIIASLKQQMETLVQEKFQNFAKENDRRLASNENSMQEKFRTFKTEMDGKFSMFIVSTHFQL